MAELAEQFVSPFGRLHTVQHGIEISTSRSLRDRFLTADSSEADLNPEAARSLRMRLLHDSTR